jgi:hypothetical protein
VCARGARGLSGVRTRRTWAVKEEAKMSLLFWYLPFIIIWGAFDSMSEA